MIHLLLNGICEIKNYLFFTLNFYLISEVLLSIDIYLKKEVLSKKKIYKGLKLIYLFIN